MYKPKNFAPYELVCRNVYELLGEHDDNIYGLFDPNVLKWIQYMRDRYGSFTVNDWYWGGASESRGLRTTASPYYSKGSMHSVGKAIDLLPTGDYSAQEIISDLKEVKLVPFITRIEDLKDMTWIHGDTKQTNKGVTHFFLP